MKSTGKNAPRLAAIFVSALLHMGVLYAYSIPPSGSVEDEEIIQVMRAPELASAVAPRPEPDEKPAGQVVDLGEQSPDDPPPPENARYLSERNMRVERETVRKGRPGGGERKNNISLGRGEDDRSRDSSARDGAVSRAKNRGESAYTREDLLLSMADIDDVLKGDHGSLDYLPQAARGDITSLNARRYAYAAFYNRLKKVVAFYWEPWPAVERIGWTGRTLETKLRLVVEADGTLESVEVVSSCGYPEVDAAAVRALRKSAPIYNIPKALLNKEGRFDEVWSFYITAN